MGANPNYTGHIIYRDVTIANSGTTPTDGVDCGQYTLCGVTIPSGLDGTSLSFTTATTYSGTYNVMHTGAADFALVVAASRYIAFDGATVARFMGQRYLKPVLATQTGAITLTLHLVPNSMV